MEDQRTAWVHPGRITSITTGPGGGYLLVIWSTKAAFAARDLDRLEVVRDLKPLGTLPYDETGEVYYSVELELLLDYVETGAGVMLEIDEQDETIIQLYPDALCQEGPYLPYELYLVCPVQRQGTWFRRRDTSVYECACGAIWDVAPEDGEDTDGLMGRP